VRHDGVDVLAASGPCGLAAAVAGDGTAHAGTTSGSWAGSSARLCHP